MLPIVSIITVCYNAESVILPTLKSVTTQSYPSIEYIVIDGASSDSTLELVRQYAPKAIVRSEVDRGIYDAMNKGLRLATGDYLWFLNAGDTLPSAELLEQIIREAYPTGSRWPDIIYGDCLLVDKQGKVLAPRRLRPPRDLSWQSFQRGMLVCHQSFIAKRSICPLYDERYRYSSDVDWCIRVMKEADRFHQIKYPISHYLSEGATTQNRVKSLLERFDVMRRHYGLATTLYWHIRFLLGSSR